MRNQNIGMQNLHSELQAQKLQNEKLAEEMIQAKKSYDEQFQQHGKMQIIVSDWLSEMKTIYMQQLEVLSNQNAQFITSNQLLENQVDTLQTVKQQIQTLSEDTGSLEINGVFLNTSEYAIQQEEMLQIGNLIWNDIKSRISSALAKPWDALANKEHNDQIMFMTEELAELKK